MEKKLLTVAVVGVIGIIIIAFVVVFQFAQQQSDRQAAIDLVNQENLKAEYGSIYETYSKEAVAKCSQYSNPNKIGDTTPAQEKCYEDLMDKYGIFDSKYDSVRTEVMTESADRLIEATDNLLNGLYG
jgi:hypothetical protein